MPEDRRFRTVTVVGLGAVGGSVAKGMLRRLPGVPVFGVDPDGASAALAARDGVRVQPALGDCDVQGGAVVFATPIDATLRLVRETAPLWRAAALATDVASLKAPVMDAAARGAATAATAAGAAAPSPAAAGAAAPSPAAAGAAAPSPFVGSHPMCGTERSGWEAARADLFDGARVWLCPAAVGGAAVGRAATRADAARSDADTPRSDADAAVSDAGPARDGPEAAARAFWRLLGARPRSIGAARHDRAMSMVSHLPQLLANALAATLDDAGLAADLLGPGGRDMTRLAGSSPSMWLPLLAAAAEDDAAALLALEGWIGRVRDMLRAGDADGLEALMERGGRWLAAGG